MKNNILKVVSTITLPIAFIALFFIYGGADRGVTSWLGFIFSLLFYAIFVAVPLILPASDSTYLFGLTIAKFTGVFFVIGFIFNLLFIFADFENWVIPLTIIIVLLAVFITVLAYLISCDNKTAQKENSLKQNANDVKFLVSKAKIIVDSCYDFEIKRIVKRVYDELISCPVSSNQSVNTIDSSILYQLEDLRMVVASNNRNEVEALVNSIISLIKERKLLSNKNN